MRIRSRYLAVVAAMGLLLVVASCDKRPTRPTSPTSPTGPTSPPPVPGADSVQISGNRVLTAVGQTSQFTAANGSRDVTAEGRWSVFPRGGGNISPTGLLTAQRLGRFVVSFEYSRFSTGAEVTVTPPGTMAVLGYMFHPESGTIVGAQVRNLQSGQLDDTPDGYFMMGNLTDLRMSATKNLFEPVEFIATTDLYWFGLELINGGVPMQKVMRVEVGNAQTTDVLRPDDVEYRVTGETFCQPCRLVRLFSQTSGTIRIRITWTDSSTLNLWVNGQMFSPTGTREILAELPITSGKELIVYLGKIRGAGGNRVTFTFAASPAA
ncbi:MAG TPA: hypothetical protein VNJ03_14110 [Vicinamibacterales bacterium]|nr:hypothetical protein [Vicinamibacterales bacterium]